jgi:MerR family transcriptional regulator, thiopeptide resistance regulator
MRIQDVARASGVTSRTLRHYDAIGLLRPRQTGPNGVREYGDAELVRLQRILVLRELGLPLDRIAGVLDGTTDDTSALRAHVEQLRRQRARIDRMITAVERTIIGIEQGEPMQDKEMFDGFAEDPYAEEAQQRWPDHYAESQRRLGRMSKDEQRALFERGGEVTRQLGELFTSGAAVDDPAVQEWIGRHYAWIDAFWTPNREAYVGLGRMYVDDPRFAANYEKVAPGLAVFMRDAMAVWAEANLPA